MNNYVSEILKLQQVIESNREDNVTMVNLSELISELNLFFLNSIRRVYVKTMAKYILAIFLLSVIEIAMRYGYIAMWDDRYKFYAIWYTYFVFSAIYTSYNFYRTTCGLVEYNNLNNVSCTLGSIQLGVNDNKTIDEMAEHFNVSREELLKIINNRTF